MRRSILIISGMLVLVVISIVGLMVGMSHTMGDLAVEMNTNRVDAVLASADVKDAETVSVPVLYYEQTKDECIGLDNAKMMEARQFEWSECGYYNKAIETEMTEATLNSEYLPVASGGKMLSNRGMKGAAFDRWFKEVDGKSRVTASMINFLYNAKDASFLYEDNNFYPVGKDKLFTMNLGVPIEIMGEGKESFEIVADDDTWVYINDKIVLDMGGIHSAVSGVFEVRANGEVYAGVGGESLGYTGVKLDSGVGAIVRIFHANRDSDESVFRVLFKNTLLNVADTVLAWDGDVNNGATVAYNPEDPSYVAPLGESLTTRPDKSRMILTSVVVQGVAIVVLVVAAAVTASMILRNVRRGR